MSDEPLVVDVCWPVDTGCCSKFDEYDSEVQDRAIALATSTLRSLTGNQVGGCPTTIRPCYGGACDPRWSSLWGSAYYPVDWAGAWYNCGACAGGCIHNGLPLPRPVGRIDAVTIGGVPLAASDYALVDGNVLLRTNGLAWPTAQDLTKPDTEVGTWSITYLHGYPVDANGAYAAGLLACEYAKACSGASCALPSGVRDITRAGVSMTITPGAFPNGLTGIRAVDAYLRQWNPNGLSMPSTIYVPPKVSGFHSWR